jgi:hypothetical protein
LIKAADMLIARRADTRARADFATWNMMVKLNGASALPQEAQTFLQSYKALLRQMPQDKAGEATIRLMYQAYYAEMGGTGAAPELPAHSVPQATDNVTAFKRPPPPRPKAAPGPATKSRLPVGLIFVCLIVVYVGIRYYWQ